MRSPVRWREQRPLRAPTIKVFEVWIPSEDNCVLELGAGYYGDINSFQSASVEVTFAPGVGLPGEAWQQKRPVLFPDLADSTRFVRANAAQAAGLCAGLAIPLLDRDDHVQAVVTILCDTGVLEIWEPRAGDDTLVLRAGAYRDAKPFGASSASYQFPKGVGLPGLVWSNLAPIVMLDLTTEAEFLRKEEAAKAGLHSGLGIPVLAGDELRAVIVILSPEPLPITGAFDLWTAGESAGENTVILQTDAVGDEPAHAATGPAEQSSATTVSDLLASYWVREASMIARGTDMPDDVRRADAALAAGLSAGLGLPVTVYPKPKATLVILS